MTQSVRSHTGPAALIKLAQDVLNTEIAGLAAVRDRLNARTPEKAPLVLALGLLAACTGRVVVTGIGKSGLVGRKLAATFSSTGTPAFFLHPVEGAHGDLGSLRKDDVIIAISNSGETAELNAILPALKSLGTSLIAMTGREDSTLGRLADVTLHSGVPREACPHGLAPTASTTAVLALGDAGRLSDAAKIIYGKRFPALPSRRQPGATPEAQRQRSHADRGPSSAFRNKPLVGSPAPTGSRQAWSRASAR